jgi:hypothetical protein
MRTGKMVCKMQHEVYCPPYTLGNCTGHGSRPCGGSHTVACDHQTTVEERTCQIHTHESGCDGQRCDDEENFHVHNVFSNCDLDEDGVLDCGITPHTHQSSCYEMVRKCGMPDHAHSREDGCYSMVPKTLTQEECGCGGYKQQTCTNSSCEPVPCPGESCDKKEQIPCTSCGGTSKRWKDCDGSCEKDCEDCGGHGYLDCATCDQTGIDPVCACDDSACVCFGEDPACPKRPQSIPDPDPPDVPPFYVDPKIGNNDSTGPRYRKIGLNGLPLSDGKPQDQDESGQPEEETYVDAFSLQLRHAVTDVYAEAPGSLLSLMVRRDVSEETWSQESLETPDTRPHLPFGPGWSSNLCSYVKFETECVSRDNTVNINGFAIPVDQVEVGAAMEAELNSGLPSFDRITKATVVDEAGTGHSYVQGAGGWEHTREQPLDVKTAQNVFTGGVLIKKFGTVCYYESTPISQTFGEIVVPMTAEEQLQMEEDAFLGKNRTPKLIHYARLVEVRDRHGNRLKYHYPVAGTLIPDRIYDPERPGHQLQIVQNAGRVVQVISPDGQVVSYSYPGGGMNCLLSVSRGGSTVSYAYEQVTQQLATALTTGYSTPG